MDLIFLLIALGFAVAAVVVSAVVPCAHCLTPVRGLWGRRVCADCRAEGRA